MDQHKDDNARLAYWLTNTITLLHLLQRNLKPATKSSGRVKRAAAAAKLSVIKESIPGVQTIGGGSWLTLLTNSGLLCGTLSDRYLLIASVVQSL